MTIYITNNIYIYVRMYIYEDVKPVCLYVLHNKKAKKNTKILFEEFLHSCNNCNYSQICFSFFEDINTNLILKLQFSSISISF